MRYLTKRESEVLQLIAQGDFNKEIAVKLGISEQTVKNHIISVMRKLDARNRTHGVVKALQLGLIEMHPLKAESLTAVKPDFSLKTEAMLWPLGTVSEGLEYRLQDGLYQWVHEK